MCEINRKCVTQTDRRITSQPEAVRGTGSARATDKTAVACRRGPSCLHSFRRLENISQVPCGLRSDKINNEQRLLSHAIANSRQPVRYPILWRIFFYLIHFGVSHDLHAFVVCMCAFKLLSSQFRICSFALNLRHERFEILQIYLQCSEQ